MLYSCKDGSFYSFIIKNSKTYSTLKERNTWEILLVVNIKINSQLLQINHFYLKKKKLPALNLCVKAEITQVIKKSHMPVSLVAVLT